MTATTTDTVRRAFLRGELRPGRQALPPPWARADFADHCTRCDDCVRACPAAILVRGDGGFPTVDFGRGGCNFCGDCAAACAHGALSRDGGRPWHLGVTVGAPCIAAHGVTCRACGDACEPGAIRFRLQPGGRAQPGIDHSLCNGCGSCIATCPATAIRTEEAT